MSQKNTQITLTLSQQSVIKVVLFGIVIALLIYVRSLVVTVLLAFVVASFAKYLATLLKKRYRIPYTPGLITIFIFLAVVLFSSFALLLPIVIREGYSVFTFLGNFAQDFESQLQALGLPLDITTLRQFTDIIPNIGGVALGVLGTLGQIITYIVLILVLGFYIAIDKTGVYSIVKIFVPDTIKDDVPYIVKRIQTHIGKWATREIFIATMMGMFMYSILAILGIRYAVFLSLLTALGGLIPFIGPILSMGLVIIYVSLQSSLLGIAVILLIVSLYIIKQLLLLPIVFNNGSMHNPLVIIISLMVGGVIAGPLGVIIAMPVVSLARIVYDDIQHYD